MNEMTVFATNPKELAVAQAALLEQLTVKRNAVQAEVDELTEGLATAVRNKWQTKTLRAAVKRRERTKLYYEKVMAAVSAGYLIVPDMQADIFAIRTAAGKPKAKRSRSLHWGLQQGAQQLPPGEGRYVSVNPMAEQHDIGDGKTEWVASDFQEVGFPVVGVKPQIMDATGRAMAWNLFDEIGLVRAGGDPIVVGNIKGEGYRRCWFFIAWWVDINTI